MLSLGGPGGRLREVEFAADAPVILRNSYKMPSTKSGVRMFSQTGHAHTHTHTDTWNAKCKDLTHIQWNLFVIVFLILLSKNILFSCI